MPELRKDPIIDRWVIIAQERGQRPDDFKSEADQPGGSFCPFCPGNEDKTPPEVAQWGRAADASPNSEGWNVRVVPNKFPALTQEGDLDRQGLGMFDLMNGIGAHEVVIENPGHEWDYPEATPEDVQNILSAYIARMNALKQDERFVYTIIFRNEGTVAGASLAHPHSQIISVPIIPDQVKDHLDAARTYYKQKSRCVFCDVLRQEISMRDRIVEENEHFVVLSPFAARFPFELQIYPRRHQHDFTQMTPEEVTSLGDTMARSLRRIKVCLNNPAYNMMVQSAPHERQRPGHPEYWGTLSQDFHWHIDILPRLTKVAGFEWGTGFYINPVSPEQATRFLRDVEI
jgi:UDPglucose--hexose-1-phosphate uridylyltransferase